MNGFLFILARALHAVLSQKDFSDGDPSPGRP